MTSALWEMAGPAILLERVGTFRIAVAEKFSRVLGNPAEARFLRWQTWRRGWALCARGALSVRGASRTARRRTASEYYGPTYGGLEKAHIRSRVMPRSFTVSQTNTLGDRLRHSEHPTASDLQMLQRVRLDHDPALFKVQQLLQSPCGRERQAIRG